MTYKYLQKNAEKFHCQACSFSCSKESDWTRHISTRKHQNTYKILTNDLQKNAEKDDYGLKSPSGVKNAKKTPQHYSCVNVERNISIDKV